MPRIRQKRVARKIIEAVQMDVPPTGGQILESVGYPPSIQKNPGIVLESKGVREALNEYGFSEDNAKKVVGQILNDGRVKPDARLKAADQVFKVHGSYAPEKNLNINVTAEKPNPELEKIAELLNEKLKG